MTQAVYILRGVPGAGKSTLAEQLIKGRHGVICTADDYFATENGYAFDASKLGEAHKACREKFVEALRNGSEVVVVANTNIKEKDFRWYEEGCEFFEVPCFRMVVENNHGGENVHGVPDDKLVEMENNLRAGLKLR